MGKIVISIMLIIFPILIYLVFGCYNSLNNKNIKKVIFIITMITSLYLFLEYNLDDATLLVFCNIPILICYFKKEKSLGLILSAIVVIFGYLKYDMDIYVLIIKYLFYFVIYICLYNKKEFNYLFLKMSGIVQGFFITFEYFINYYGSFYKLLGIIIYIFIIYSLTFLALYLFKLADNISSLYISYNKMMEENKIKDSLFKLTHEIKNPLAVCKGYLDMIDVSNVNKSKKYIGIIKSEIDRSLNVIADFTEYSKIKINKEVMDIGLLLSEVYDAFYLLVKDKNILFTYNNCYDKIFLMGDYERLKQVFINIVKNSIESIDNNGIINLDVKKCNNILEIIISDNGIGMDEEELSKVKEMFFTTKKNGTGLGVALSCEIVLAHGGEMEYCSKKNKGTKCIVKLPL